MGDLPPPAGLFLALACDLRLAAPAADFRAAGINNGLTASELGLSFLPPRSRPGSGSPGSSQPGVELTKKSLQAGMASSSLEAHLTSEGLGQLYLRLLTDNFEEATQARKEGRDPVFRDRR